MVCSGGLCGDAGEGAQRTFADASVDVVGESDAFLLAVYTTPTGDASPNAVASFELSTGGDAPAALRMRRPAPTVRTDPARMQFERARRAWIDAWIDRPPRRGQALTPEAPACTAECGEQMCWRGACTDTVDLKFDDGATLTASLQNVVRGGPVAINVLVESGNAAQAEAIVEAFATTWASELQLLGLDSHGGALDRDGDGRLTVVFTDHTSAAVPASLVGFFNVKDFTGVNASDLLWARVPAGGAEAAAGALAHEYVHLASFATRVFLAAAPQREAYWLDEGMAHVMEDLIGWGPSTFDALYTALAGWSQAGFATEGATVDQDLVVRGQAMMLLRHMIDRRGGDAAGLLGTLRTEAAVGFEHSAFDAAAVGDWLVGTFTTGHPQVMEAARAFDFAAMKRASTGYLSGVDPRGDYETLDGADVSLDGPPLAGEGDVPSDDVVYESGSAFFLVTGQVPGTLQLRGTAPACVDFHLRVVKVWE
jgi:hypothetical protein